MIDVLLTIILRASGSEESAEIGLTGSKRHLQFIMKGLTDSESIRLFIYYLVTHITIKPKYVVCTAKFKTQK